ncbi:MAG: FecR family protein [Balneolaceae bacterium]|nr:FecR family protein [Balneolaceae bacterium]
MTKLRSSQSEDTIMKSSHISSLLGWPLIAVFVLGLASAEIYNYNSADRPLAFVRRFKPEVNIRPQDVNAQKGHPLYSGDTLATGEYGYAAVQFMDKSFAKVKPNSELIVRGQINQDKSTSSRIALEAGEIFMEVIQQGNNNFEVSTSKSVASVKGTSFGVRWDDFIWVVEGEIQFTATVSGETVTLTDRMFGQVNDDNSITTGKLTDEQLQKLREDFENFEGETGEQQQMRLRFRDQNGQTREIEIQYYENNQEDGSQGNDN